MVNCLSVYLLTFFHLFKNFVFDIAYLLPIAYLNQENYIN